MGICWLNIKIMFHQSFPVCGRKCQTKFFKKHVSCSSGPLHPKLKSPLGVNFLQILFPAGPNIHRGISQNPLHQFYLVKFVYVLHWIPILFPANSAINYNIATQCHFWWKMDHLEASNCFEYMIKTKRNNKNGDEEGNVQSVSS